MEKDQKIGRREMCRSLLFGSLLGLTAVAQEKVTPGGRTSPVLPIPTEDERILELVRRGATMEEIAKVRDPIARNPQDALRELKTGNSRFFSGVARRPEMSAAERRAQVLSQTPFATILSCSDSRVPTEIVFDQGLGSLFITRIAGNVIDTGTAGSIEYSVEHLKVHLVVVMGHEGCGAVKAALLPEAQRNREAANVRALLNSIEPAVRNLPKIRDEKAKTREAVIANVRLQVNNLKQNPVIQAGIKRGQIGVVGAYYEITSGAVDFLETDEELRLQV
ncbi:MAG: carbonic anhydrase [Acidobacteriota bacterium]|nr:carbonic anhydrase [Acidobacteriota bacterium]